MKKFRLNYFTLGAFYLLFLASGPFSQTVEELLELTLEELANVKIIAASRGEKSAKELPATIYIITRKEILNNNYATLVDALKYAPAVRAVQPGTGSLGEKYFMRGMSGNDYVKILIDGIPIRPSVVDGMPLQEQIDMRNIERIEIVYGPASALYGADALAGVINIVSYVPEGNATFLETYIGISDGVEKRHAGTKFYMHHVKDNVKMNVHGGFSNKDDLNIVKNGKDFQDAAVYDTNTHFHELPAKSYYFGMDFSINNIILSYDQMYRRDHSSIEQSTNIYIYDNPNLIYGETIQNASAKHVLSKNPITLTSFLSYLRYRLDRQSAFGIVFYSTPLYKYQASDDILWEEVLNYQFSESLEFLGGLSYQYSGAIPKTNDLTKPIDESFYSAFSTDIPAQGQYQNRLFGDFGFNPLTYYNYGAFLQTSYSKDFFSLVGGLRFDDHSEYESTLNPRIAGLVNFSKKTSARVSYNEAFRAPTPYKVYDAFGFENGDGTVTYIRVPNENLQPEKFRAFEASIRHFFTENISLDIAAYRQITTGLISVGIVTLDHSKYPYARFTQTQAESNLNGSDKESILNGVDLAASFSNIFRPIKLNARLLFSYTMGEENLPNGGTVDVHRNFPKYLTKLRINASPVSNLYLGIDNIFHGEWYTKLKSADDLDKPEFKSEAYFTSDFISNYKIPTKKGKIKLFFKVLNIFDQTYGGVRLKDNPQYQRSFYAGVDYML